MFSEVYWHHAVRSATAMLQRAFYLLHQQLDLDQLFRQTEQTFIQQMLSAAGALSETDAAASSECASRNLPPAAELLTGLFGPTRRLYKRLAEFSHFQERAWYERLARQPYQRLVEASEAFASAASRTLGRRIAPHEILFDAPPVRREVEFQVEVYFPKERVYRMLAEVSPALHTLATRQFDDYVKRVRIMVHPGLAQELSAAGPLEALMQETLQQTV
jgi:HD superfamily phosphohydrolase